MEKLLSVKGIRSSGDAAKPRFQIENISKRDIAIVGLSGRFGWAENAQDFWEGIKEGSDFISGVSNERKKVGEAYIKSLERLGVPKEEFEFIDAAYMKRIDNFDCSMFNISPKEADLMDPNQRLLLEVVWEAIEDAGYGGKTLSGTRTGVYVGYSSDFGEEYKRYSRMVTDTNDEAAVTGNIRSIIGSRISYLLDLKGPSVMIDTACSSALVAVHTACQAIRNGECDYAIAGSVKVLVVPVREKSGQGNIGIGSSTGRAKTFDDSSDGTGVGEGVGAVLLKPLNKAVEDGDHIYAVIKGSAANQDGSSVGITAPNMAAQEEVILRAWKDAGIDPETITYIEAHGTGTKLGDPIEITGIKRAFENYTQKKQFCAVASVKTNIGHLDHAAGIAALIKSVMALKNGEIPACLHFQKPNRKIAFEDSPVYVNDRLSKWQTEGFPRRCGISSFGLSGTNCHLILEEYKNKNELKESVEGEKPQILSLSARNRESLSKLVDLYSGYLDKEESEIRNICYTANTGRGHYNLRLAVIAENMEDLKSKIGLIKNTGLVNINEKGILLGEHKIVSASKQNKLDGEITSDELKDLNLKADNLAGQAGRCANTEEYRINLEELARLYIKGGEIDWKKIYHSSKYKKVSLPVYPFLKEKHWVDPGKAHEKAVKHSYGNIGHPVLDTCLANSMEIDIYATNFSVEKHWVLSEHKVAGTYVVPGTTHIEIASQIARGYRSGSSDVIEMNEVVFLAPLAAQEGMEVEAQTVVKKDNGYYEFSVISKSEAEEGWRKHSEGRFFVTEGKRPDKIDIEELKKKFSKIEELSDIEEEPDGVETGPRFKNFKYAHLAEDEILAYMELPREYIKDLEEYYMHPALLDSAVNMCNGTIGQGLYLPLSYKKLKIYDRLPACIYSYISRKNEFKENSETGCFDISILDTEGNVIAVAEDYTVKKVHSTEFGNANKSKVLDYFEIGWNEKLLEDIAGKISGNAVLVFTEKGKRGTEVAEQLKNQGLKVYCAEIGSCFEKIDECRYSIGFTEEDYIRLVSELPEKVSHVIHMFSLESRDESGGLEENEVKMEKGVYSLFYLTKALVNLKAGNIRLALISDYAYEVSKTEKQISPHNAAFIGLGRVIQQEYPDISCVCIDIDESTKAENIISELAAQDNPQLVAYRDGKRYVEEFRAIDKKDLAPRQIEIKNGGVYIITGGTGGIGLEVARYLSEKGKVNLCMITRSALPERERWEEILEANNDYKLCKKITDILDMEKTGSIVLHYPADVSNPDSVLSAISEIKSRYGTVNGVIHAAGVAGDGFIIKKETGVFRNVLVPKTTGTCILDKMTEDFKLDFFIMFSSITSLTGAPGQGDYTAANAFMDSYAQYMARQGKNALAINWPAWSETGMAVDYNAVSEDSLFKPVSTGEGINAFEKLVNSAVVRAIPAKLNYKVIELVKDTMPIALSDEIRRNFGKTKGSGINKADHSSKDLGSISIVLKGKINQDYTDTEHSLAKLWALVLGINEVDVYDNFSDLGGDSILSTRLLREMQKEYGGLVDISDVFTYSTIGDMAAYLDSKMNKKKEFERIEEDDSDIDAELDAMLKRLADGDISVEEAEKLLE
ncbi:MAG: type I polyketide synthase [Clostridia bacterium]|nr:type I polyketide synthase [Clostridia bacterium]